MKLVSLKEIHEKRMRSPAYRKAYKELEPEFAIIGAVIDARMRKGVTQAELARRMGTKQSAIARFESGRGNPTLDFIQRLSRALGLKLRISVQ